MTTTYTDPNLKHDALLLFDAVDSNPNGDPDNAGKPRTDWETGFGLVSDVSLKRKIRDSVMYQVGQGLLNGDRWGIFIRRGDALNTLLEQAYKDLGQPIPAKRDKQVDQEHVKRAQEHMMERYFDVRMFGAVMSTGTASAGKMTGPFTVGIGRTIDAVQPMELGITRTASTKEEDKDNASQMGNKTVIPYGLYAVRMHYQPTKTNQVTAEDLEVLWRTVATMFEVTRSAARPDVTVRGLFVFTHDNPLGNAPARALLDRIRVAKKDGVASPASYDDYVVTEPDVSALPAGVSYSRLV